MKKRHTQRASQLGISLVEMAVAIAILAVILVGVLLGIQKLQFDRRLNNARADIPVTIAALGGVYATQPNTQNASTKILSLMNVWPKDRVSDAGLDSVKVNGHFQNSTELVFGSSRSFPPRIKPGYQGFAYWITNVPPEACLPLLQAMVANGSVAAVAVVPLSTIPSATDALYPQLSAYINGGLVLDMGKATTACAGAANRHVVAVVARV
jgi:Tfp pilus assembly protein PilE